MPEVAAAPTVERVLRRATGVLVAAGCDTPRLDAELLLASVLEVGRERLVLDAAGEVGGNALACFERLVVRRSDREPVAYILGRKDFRHITLSVDRRVLVPRPETELLVEVGLSLDAGARVVDVGTGSGAIALALKDERPDLEIWGTDASAEAIAVATENARALGLAVQFVVADLLDGVTGPFDAVLANLPYVLSGTVLPPEIARYEPGAALFAGPDGLDVIRRLVTMLDGVPLAALEVGACQGVDQAITVRGLLRDAGYRSIEVLRDLAGHERVVVGRR